MKKRILFLAFIAFVLSSTRLQAHTYYTNFEFCDINGTPTPNPSACGGDYVYVKNLSYVWDDALQMQQNVTYSYGVACGNLGGYYSFRNDNCNCEALGGDAYHRIFMADWYYGQIVAIPASCCPLSPDLNCYYYGSLAPWNGNAVTTNVYFRQETRVYSVTCIDVNAGTDITYCAGSNVTLNGTSNGTSNAWTPATYVTNPSSLTSTVTTTTGMPSPYTLTLTASKNGCSKSDQVTLTRINTPVNLGHDRLICLGQTVTLNAGNAGSTYLWSTGATTQSISVSTPGTYCVTVTNPATGCSGTDCAVVSYYPEPIAGFNISQSCVNCTPQITVSTTASPSYTHSWQLWSSNANGDLISLLATGTGMSYTFTSGITYNAYYKVRHMVSSICESSVAYDMIFINPSPIDPEFDLMKVSAGKSHYHLQATAHSIPSCAGFWWRISDITNGTPVNVMENPANWWASTQIPVTWFPGYCCDATQTTGEGSFLYGKTYRIERAVWSGCSPWTYYYTDFTASLYKTAHGEEGDLQIIAQGTIENGSAAPGLSDDAFRIYPNPSDGKFKMEYDFSFASGTRILIVNSLGSVVYDNISSLPDQIDLSGQAKGVYFVKVNHQNSAIVKKLIIQ